jgi:hypothetical protein
MRRTPSWILNALCLAPWVLLPLMPAIALTLWVCGVG